VESRKWKVESGKKEQRKRLKSRYQMSDIRKDKGKETAKEESKKAFKCICVLSFCIYRRLITDN